MNHLLFLYKIHFPAVYRVLYWLFEHFPDALCVMCAICFPLQNNARHCAPVNMYLLGAFQVSNSQSKEGMENKMEIAFEIA
jgi:hypothetical protein